jgi:sterol desaturase/sphingolipid hydroxylase (fatty acid hydroxylase superfamily)
VLPYTDTNFGNVFSVWDRLFRTYREMERTQVVYGVDTHMAPAEHTTVGALLTMPLRPGTKGTGRPG